MPIKSNFNQFAKDLQRKSDAFVKEVKEIVELNTGDLEMEAIRNAPGGGDLIRTTFGTQTQDEIRGQRNWSPISQSIGYKIVDGGLKGVVYVERSAGELAAWVEFSTGQDAAVYLATVPIEWRELAATFYRNGKGTIIGQPYMLPAFMKYKEQFLKDLKQAIKEFTKK